MMLVLLLEPVIEPGNHFKIEILQRSCGRRSGKQRSTDLRMRYCGANTDSERKSVLENKVDSAREVHRVTKLRKSRYIQRRACTLRQRLAEAPMIKRRVHMNLKDRRNTGE